MPKETHQKMGDIPKAKKTLLAAQAEILVELRSVVARHRFNYRTFGSDIEKYLTDILISILKRKNLILDKKDYQIAPNKNHFPDLQLYPHTGTSLAVEYKTGNKSKKKGNVWTVTQNSNNDMGTLNMWEKKLEKFGGENVYYIFVVYDFTDSKKEVLDVQVAPFYRFIGKDRHGNLKYREKDGNLRPKDFFATPPITTFAEFQGLFRQTICYRSKRIINKHDQILRVHGC